MDEVINYVMESPGNTNPNVLRGMLQNSSGGGNTLIVKIELDTETEKATLNKTWKEIFDADCVIIYMIHNLENTTTKVYATLQVIGYYVDLLSGDLVYSVTCLTYVDEKTGPNFLVFTTDSEDGYPEK